jgi:hypothetical protein
VTVAGWPTLTRPTSDSLSGTTSWIELRSLRTANPELEELELLELPVALEELPPVAVLPEDVPVAAPLEAVPPEEDELVEALLVPAPETVSPTSPLRDTIVPLCGA